MDFTAPPKAQDDWAYFFDVDGTLAEIAATPDAAVVTPETIAALDRLRQRTNGAVAIVSGRPLSDLDRMFAPLSFAAAGLHGMERRSATGAITRTEVATAPLDAARPLLRQFAQSHPGILIEDKGVSIAMHFRAAPQDETAVDAITNTLTAQSKGQLLLLPGKMVVELRLPGPTKGDVVTTFLSEAPFSGRLPVFVGDDVTDEDGFRAVNAGGGHSIRIGVNGASVAKYRMRCVSELQAWLQGQAS